MKNIITGGVFLFGGVATCLIGMVSGSVPASVVGLLAAILGSVLVNKS